jgi:TPR repeat protein
MVSHLFFFSTEKSAAQVERDGFYWLGWCFDSRNGCNRNVKEVRKNYFVAAELGYVDSMIDFGTFLDKSDL